MTPTEILPDLLPGELIMLAAWLHKLPPHVFPTMEFVNQVTQLESFLAVLADLRRQT